MRCYHHVLSLALLAICAGAALVGAGEPGIPINVGHQKQLFIDNRFLQKASGVEVVVNAPRPTGEKLLQSAGPWEKHAVGGYTSVVEEDGRIHMWYETLDLKERAGVAYAFSVDGGATWTRPVLNVIEYDGSKDNNLVILDVTGTHVFLNRSDAPPDQKYVMICGAPNRAYVSPEGVHWTQFGSEPFLDLSEAAKLPKKVRGTGLDSQNVMFWDTRLNKYVCYPRVNFYLPDGWRPGNFLRTFCRLESDTLGGFSGLRMAIEPDAKDPPESDFYTSAAVQYPYAADAYFMFPAIYFHSPKRPKVGSDGPLDIRFAASRDGIIWQRPERRPIIRLGLEGSDSGGSLYAGYGLTRKGDEVSLYYTAYDVTHAGYLDRGYLGGTITRAIYRLDGFMSVDSTVKGGQFTTPSIVFDGSRLELNVDASAAGEVRVEMLNEQGQPIPGFALADCEPLVQSGVAKRVLWKGSDDLASLRSKPVKLRFAMRDAKLYAFQFVNP